MEDLGVAFKTITVLLLCCLCHAAVVDVSLVVRRVPWKPDGYPRPVLGFFREDAAVGTSPFPGPLIRVHVNDTLRVKVTNMFHESMTSVHWHGVHCSNNAWQDGTPGITDCGIRPRETRRYEFVIGQIGTFWYHAHSGAQYADGLQGPLIVDPIGEDPIKTAFPYVEEYPVLLQDWLHESWEDVMTGAFGPFEAYEGYKAFYPFPPASLLINGHGKFDCNLSRTVTYEFCESERAQDAQCTPLRPSYLGACGESSVPEPKFTCSGKYVRLRIINGSGNMPLRFWVDHHKMLIVAVDGMNVYADVSKMERTILISVGQRVDVIVPCDASDKTKRYKMYVTVAPAFMPRQFKGFPNITSWGTLGYGSSSSSFPVAVPQLAEPFAVDDPWFGDLDLDMQLRSMSHPPSDTVEWSEPAVERLYLEAEGKWDEGLPGTPLEYWLVNGKSWVPPPEPYLQTWHQRGVLPSSAPGGHMPYQESIVQKLRLGSVYEVVMVNLSPQQHPWHLHGYAVDIIDAGFFNNGNRVTSFDKGMFEKKFALSSRARVLTRRDSWLVPTFGYTTIRLKAINPGPWLFHCHVEWHMMMGMALLYSVEPYESMVSPPRDLPVCSETYGSLRRTISNSSSSSTAGIVVVSIGAFVSGVLIGALVMFLIAFFRNEKLMALATNSIQMQTMTSQTSSNELQD